MGLCTKKKEQTAHLKRGGRCKTDDSISIQFMIIMSFRTITKAEENKLALWQKRQHALVNSQTLWAYYLATTFWIQYHHHHQVLTTMNIIKMRSFYSPLTSSCCCKSTPIWQDLFCDSNVYTTFSHWKRQPWKDSCICIISPATVQISSCRFPPVSARCPCLISQA